VKYLYLQLNLTCWLLRLVTNVPTEVSYRWPEHSSCGP